MVPEAHDLAFPASVELGEHIRSAEFKSDILVKLKEQHVVDCKIKEPQKEMVDGKEQRVETLELSYTRNNAGGLKDAIDFLINHLVMKGLDASAIRGAIPRPKSDSFEDSLPFFESKLLQRAEPPVESTDSPTRSIFGDEAGERSGMFDRLRKPGSMSSFTSIFNGRKNGNNSPGSLFKHASSNASKASLASLESQGSAYRNPWNDSGINLPDDDHHHPNSNWHLPTPRFDGKFSFVPHSAAPGDVTPRYDPRASVDSGRPSTSNSASGYPGPIGPPR